MPHCQTFALYSKTTFKTLKYMTVSAKTSLVRTKNLNSFFGPAYNYTKINSYPHSMSAMARLKWSAFLRGGFTAL